MKNLCMVVMVSFVILACEDPTQESPTEDTEESDTTVLVVEVSTEEVDLCPNHPGKTSPGQCGCLELDVHSDSDSVADCNDQCPFNSDRTEPNVCGCGGCGVPLDSDGDGVPDCVDGCPEDFLKTEPGICGCNIPIFDDDGDGIPNCIDPCPYGPPC